MIKPHALRAMIYLCVIVLSLLELRDPPASVRNKDMHYHFYIFQETADKQCSH